MQMTRIHLDISGPLTAEMIAKELKNHKTEGHVLDVGTGKGISLQVLRKNGYKAFGIDKRSVFELGSKRYSCNADALKLPFRDSTFVAVMESFLFAQGFDIDNWPEPQYQEVFGEIGRVLQPNGIFLSSWTGITAAIPNWARESACKHSAALGLKQVASSNRNILVFRKNA